MNLPKKFIITSTNQKGQVVIPTDYRKALEINESTPLQITLVGHSVHIHPIEDVRIKSDTEDSYKYALDRTRGKWANDDWSKLSKKRAQIELKASKERKAGW